MTKKKLKRSAKHKGVFLSTYYDQEKAKATQDRIKAIVEREKAKKAQAEERGAL